ncbi:hypothetical protein TWF730_008302 [Orbilia blumenaviensis]|uniref:Uncharacterized protein n=1 Tax=Orbilia blumenaviensis TaxID=1796055 RepID=A0AAV9V2P5_9PEZI
MKELYKKYNDKNNRVPTRSSIEDIVGALQTVSSEFERTFIVVDALDECPTSLCGGNSQEVLLSTLFQLQATSNVNLFATSRYLPEITTRFEGSMCTRLEIRAHDQDVLSFLDARITNSNEELLINNREEVKIKISKAVDGMFLLAKLHFETVKSETTLKNIRKALQSLKTGQNAYDSAYEEAMTRITEQNPKLKELAYRVLSWITRATRPLTISELRHALAVEPNQSELDYENFTSRTKILSVCAGLVTINKESDIIQLVHYTTQEYFERKWNSWFPRAEADIVETCVTYLSFSIFDTSFFTETDFDERLESDVFYDYAITNWGHHARMSLPDPDIILVLLDFLRRGRMVPVLTVEEGFGEYIYRKKWAGVRFMRQAGVHIAAYLGLLEVMAILLEDTDIEVRDVRGRTSLLLAAQGGHVRVIQYLIDNSADIEAEDGGGRTPLLSAAEEGNEAAVCCLVAHGADVKAEDDEGSTPLFWAIYRGQEIVVRLLLNEGANPDRGRFRGATSLSLAARSANEAIVALLSEYGASLEARDISFNYTPLLWASVMGNCGVTRILLDHGANIEARDEKGSTPLLEAVAGGHIAVIDLLINEGACIEARDDWGSTPLLRAAAMGKIAAVKLLINSGADIEATDMQGFTPLVRAVRRGHDAVVELLIEHGANTDAKDEWGVPISTIRGMRGSFEESRAIQL